MKVIGIIGGIGAGKSTVVSTMQQLYPSHVISADQIAHEILLKGQEGYKKVVDAFGETILDENGEIIRKKLGAIVFKDKNKVAQLNNITHPIICNEIKKQMNFYQRLQPNHLIIIDAPLLLEAGLDTLTDVIIGVFATEEARILRVKQRDNLPEEQIVQRINAQKKWEELQKVITYTVDNSGSMEQTTHQIKEIINRL